MSPGSPPPAPGARDGSRDGAKCAAAAVADVRDGEARVEVEIGTALGVPDLGSLGPRPDERLRLPERAHAGALGGADPLAHALGRPGHCSTIVRLCSRANCWT